MMTATGQQLLLIRALSATLCLVIFFLGLTIVEVLNTRTTLHVFEERLNALEILVMELQKGGSRTKREVSSPALQLYHRLREEKVTENVTSKSPHKKRYESTTTPAIVSRPSRVMKTDPYPYQEFRSNPTTVIHFGPKAQRLRSRQDSGSIEILDENPVSSRPGRKPNRRLVAVHYDGDSSNYTLTDEHYAGNGRLRHPDGMFLDWSPSTWSHSVGSHRHFTYERGEVTIRRTGLYLVYAQIYYVDEHDANGYRMYVNDKAVLHCTTHSTSTHRTAIANTCHSSSLVFLTENDRITLRDVEGLRYSLFEPAKSFFGMIKLTEGVWR